MNNFSPSTDTSVGTKRFTAQEVQLAYTLMAVEYMKTIKGLNPNHQLVDKAVKLKALGFTNSKEVGDAITSEEDTTELELKFNIAKHIIDVKLQEQEDRLLESEKKAKRQKILDLMAKKQDAELEGKSLEELAKELEALN